MGAEKVLNIAKNEIGYREGVSDITKYWSELYPQYQGLAWCDCFVSWCFYKAFGESGANKALCGGLYSFYTPTSAQYYKNAGRWHEAKFAKPGDQIFFRQGIICHTGIVESCDGSTIRTIEGNASDCVMRRSYHVYDSYIAGVGRPVFDEDKQAETLTIPEGIKECPVASGIVRADELNVRTWAGIEYPNIKSCPFVYDGERVDICSKIKADSGKYWYFIKTKKGTYGFVSSSYVEVG